MANLGRRICTNKSASIFSSAATFLLTILKAGFLVELVGEGGRYNGGTGNFFLQPWRKFGVLIR